MQLRSLFVRKDNRSIPRENVLDFVKYHFRKVPGKERANVGNEFLYSSRFVLIVIECFHCFDCYQESLFLQSLSRRLMTMKI